MGKIVTVAVVIAGLVAGGAGIASAAPGGTTQISLAPGETKAGTVSCAPGRVTGTSSKSTGAWISYSSNGTTVTYSASNPTKKDQTIAFTVKCS